MNGKTWRVYYNRSIERQCWSVDEGSQDSEITVMGIRFNGVFAEAKVDSAAPTESEDLVRAWLEVKNTGMVVEKGIATFYPIPEGRRGGF